MKMKILFIENEHQCVTMLISGNTEFKEGYWIGVQYDEPFGKNDGRYVIYVLIAVN